MPKSLQKEGTTVRSMATTHQPLLQVNGLVKHFPVKKGLLAPKEYVKAVSNVTLTIQRGETYGLVGESGCGKSTTGRLILRLIEPTAGNVFFEGKNLSHMSKEEMRTMRQKMQIVFQDPYSSLNPRIPIGEAIEEAMGIFALGTVRERKERTMQLLDRVGLNEDQYYRHPHEFSGGQRQRIVLARALALNPSFVVCDEPVSALDVSIQSQIINLLKELQSDFELTYLYIAHDLSVVRHISDRVGVMYLGNLVEESPTDPLFHEPLHPYTKALLSAIPHPDPKGKRWRILLTGEVPSPLHPPSGCVFHTRCPQAQEACTQVIPTLRQVRPDRKVACHLYG
ncbi:dipeptide ABC transporter ATP-binding protein [Brevibacillus fluminis]|uniref:Dipeptide ABC transporter ATP-binding protein n=2 Tax=Brevibacillus fluminis TaxID=511487 RepID=A0A3M8DVV4_9BACL|nr:dipeptide ABC transporter ATP-binding protein [Brevibacillus fluminis]